MTDADSASAPPGIDPELLERLRRGVPLRLDRHGAFVFDEEPVTHERVREALRYGLDVTEEGEPIVRLGPQWCYITVDDTILRATAVDHQPDGLTLRLDDGRTVPLDPSTLWEEPGAGLRCQAPSRHGNRPLSVRFTNKAQMQLAEHIEPQADRMLLHLPGADRPHPIPTKAP